MKRTGINNGNEAVATIQIGVVLGEGLRVRDGLAHVRIYIDVIDGLCG
jgi:hypothetical protein